jgi:selenocysteine-specific elongation factor
VSAVTGYGLDELRSTIASALDDVSPNTDAPFRMWIDRAFSIRGAGVVVTGTVQQGSLDVDSEVELMPARQRARVRGLQRHDQPISTVYAGSRAAINLGGVELTDASRGMLLADRGTTIDTTRLIVTWRASRGFEKLPRRGAFHVHSGTADAPATIRRLDETLLLVSTDTPIAAACGDRIIIREAGRQAVVGGGEVIDPNPLRRIGGSALAAMRAEDGNVADRILRYRGPIDANELARITGGINPTSGRRIGGLWTTHELVDRLALNARSLVAPYHEQYPKRPGIPIAELASRLGFDREIVATAVAGSSDLTVEEGFVSATGFAVTLNASDEATWDSARRQLEESYAVPRASALGLDDELLRALIRNDSLVQIEPDLVYTKDQIVAMTADLKGLPDGFTVSQFSDHFGTSRRHSVPLLEWFDALGVTHRTGNTRTLR